MSDHTTKHDAPMFPQAFADFVPETLPWFLELSDHIPKNRIEEQFSLWHRVIEALPITSDEYCFLSNWLTTAHRYWCDGEVAAAQYQLDVASKRLHASGWLEMATDR
ncbi:MAG: hypothetical protein ACC628_15645 [Pirellulaceae bacterium]